MVLLAYSILKVADYQKENTQDQTVRISKPFAPSNSQSDFNSCYGQNAEQRFPPAMANESLVVIQNLAK